jgi:hypothetical protein
MRERGSAHCVSTSANRERILMSPSMTEGVVARAPLAPSQELAALFEPILRRIRCGDKHALTELFEIALDLTTHIEANRRGGPSPIGQFQAGRIAVQLAYRLGTLTGANSSELFLAALRTTRVIRPVRIDVPPGSRLLRIGRLFLPGTAYRRLEERVADLREEVFDATARGETWRARVLPIVHFVIIAMDPLRAMIIWLSRGWRSD